MAWFAAMGAGQVLYHEENVRDRADDYPGKALDYYGSRGETPLRWGGQLAERLGLDGEVTREDFRAIFGDGGARHPYTDELLVKGITRPGFEIVLSVHKSVSALGVTGRADDMHAIMDTQTDATLAALEGLMCERGGRRGQAATVTPTSGLLYAVTRHGTSRAGDPTLHDHILVANLTWMLDAKAGWKGLFSALLRDLAEQACMVGRMAAAQKAIELGYRIDLDSGESGRARDWRIVGVDRQLGDLWSKRADQVADYIRENGFSPDNYRARRIAALATREIKRFTGVDELMPHWHAELEDAGFTVEGINQAIDQAAQGAGLLARLDDTEIRDLVGELMDPEGEFMTRWKVFNRSRLVAEIGPRLYGRPFDELDRVVDAVIASPEVVPLVGIPGAREQPYTSVHVLANEQTIAETIERMIARPGPTVDRETVADAVAGKEAQVGGRLTAGQQAAIASVCGPTGGVKVVVGVAGSGKTTALDAAATALENAGYTMIGTATSGRAARTVGEAADIESRTVASLLARLDRGSLTFDRRTVLVLDEAAMTTDADLTRLLWHAERTGTTLALVGDPRQLPAVGPGGAMAAIIDAHPEIVTTMGENVRQTDPAERQTLDQMRDGDFDTAIDWYADNDRITTAPTPAEALDSLVAAWAADTQAGADTVMLAWRRDTVRNLNRFARIHASDLGWLTGDDLTAPGGREYAVGDWVVTLAPNRPGGLVTSQRGQVVAVDHDRQALTLRMDDGRSVRLAGHEIDQDHLDHGYAITVHREQSATADRAHVMAEGGGRRLAYVACSRARDKTTIHAVADDVAQAVDAIGLNWTTEQDHGWLTPATKVGDDPAVEPVPATGPEPPTPREQILARIAHLYEAAPLDPAGPWRADAKTLDELRRRRADLDHGGGHWQDTAEGAVVRGLHDARHRHDIPQLHATNVGLIHRPAARRAARDTVDALDAARQRHHDVVVPVAVDLDHKIDYLERRIDRHQADQARLDGWLYQNPDKAKEIAGLKRQLLHIDDPDLAQRLDQLDAATHRASQPRQAEPPGRDIGLGL